MGNPQNKSRKEKKRNSLIKTIRKILRLNRHARTPHHRLPPGQPLRLLELGTPIHPVARVHHHAGLVRPQLGLDARKRAPQRGHHRRVLLLLLPLLGLGRALDQPVPVVPFAGAAGAAVARKAGRVAGVAQEEVGR